MRRTSDIIATTTSGLDGRPVTSYRGVVTAHVVAGTGLFSDAFAGLSDIFGGRSGTYQKQLASINDEAVRQLRERAAHLGANAIVGLSIDHDEISGGGKSMFMVTAVGTAAVCANVPDRGTLAASNSPEKLSSEDLSIAITSRRYKRQARENNLKLSEKTWSFLCKHQVTEVAPTIVATVESFSKNPHSSRTTSSLDWAEEYFASLEREDAVQILYAALAESDYNPAYYTNLIRDLRLFDASKLSRMLSSENPDVRRRALPTCLADKTFYTQDDAAQLRRLVSEIREGFPDQSEKAKIDGMFKTRSGWKCGFCGHENTDEKTYCNQCHRDARGLQHGNTTPEQATASLEIRAEILSEVFGH